MFEKFSLLLKKNFEEVKEELKLKGIFQIGTEGILYTLIKIENSVCNHLLLAKNIDKKIVKEKILNSCYLRKDDREYTEKFYEVIDNAFKIAQADESELIYDEHLFYSLLMVKDTVALSIIESFPVDLNEILDSVKNIFELDYEDNPYLINLTKEAENNKLNRFVGRKKYIEKIIRILSKKQKNNPMLIGNAGVGKSALVEGVAMEYLRIDKGVNIYRLDLGTVIAGTKYRGDLEERIMEVLDSIKGEKNILFIDEIHNIIGNNNSESSLDIANILKPILARNEIKCIGATTLDEYYKYIAKDKALSRRFQNVFIAEPNEEETKRILKGIVKDYENFYHVKYSNEILLRIVEKSSLLTNRCFPDKAIDVLDECGLIAKLKKREKVKKEDIQRVIFEMLGIDIANFKNKLKEKKNFLELNKYYYDYLLGISERKCILKIMINYNLYPLLIDDLKSVFNITNETILKLDFSDYLDEHYSSNLFGSPSGYVGYENGGILTEHVFRYPLSIIVIDNYNRGHFSIKKQIENVLKVGEINDSKGRKINFRNCIFIFRVSSNESSIKKIGFINEKNKLDIEYLDEVIMNKDVKVASFKELAIKNILNNYKKNDYFIKLDLKINNSNIDEVLLLLKRVDEFDKQKKNIIKEDDNRRIIVEKK